MAGSVDMSGERPISRFGGLLAGRGAIVRDYLSAVSGAAGRLVFSLAYFVVLANTLSLSDFGLFATASAAGVVISRLLGFGFIATLYRVSTVRPRLIGAFTAGFAMLSVLSLPLIGGAAVLIHLVFFGATLPFGVYATVVVAESLLWRPVEAAIIVNNGQGLFGRASALTILGTALRAGAAGLFLLQGNGTLATWALWYLAANATCFVIAFGFFYPRQRLRLRPELYWRRLADSIAVAGAEVLFYLQMEFDKFIVLALGGPALSGIYAVIMRLVDLTAIPIRTFTMMLVQKMMRQPQMLASLKLRFGIEAGILLVSTMALLTLAGVLHVFPNALGRNVAQAAGLIGLAVLVPGLRNLVEYQAELLFARGQTVLRAINLGLLGLAKALLLASLLAAGMDEARLLWSLNGAFAVLYLFSALLTYSALRRPARKI
jgi:O-antigen/teichoic acid export membrane protein